jgi:hypothetical protein
MRGCSRIASRLVVATLILSSCTTQSGQPGPSVVFDTGLGALPLNPPASAMLQGVQVPPSGPWAPNAVSTPTAARDGHYAGVGVVLASDGGLCLRPITISGFLVHGNAVEFERSQGTINANGGLQMVADGHWIIGGFQGAAFRGEHLVPGPRDQPGCSYLFTLTRTGP